MQGPGLVVDTEQAVAGPAGPIPVRRDHSVRRTATIDMLWPDGPSGRMHLRGRARDIVSRDAAEAPTVARTAFMDVILRERLIEAITTDPSSPGIAALVGQRGGGHLRSALAAFVPEERNTESPLYLMLDDISGTSLIGGVVWSRWPGRTGYRRRPGAPTLESVCIGFRPGSSALDELKHRSGPPRVRPVADLVNPSDLHGWHELPDLPPTSVRRARFVDVRLDDGTIVVESGFQDSAGDPDFGRVGVHEYRIHATADLATGRLETLTPVPHILPFRECPSAASASQAIVGAPVSQLRDIVLERLATTKGCTHLNDALRALAEVPILIQELRNRRRR